MPNVSFNTNRSGFAGKPVENIGGYSLLPTSPFRSDGEAWTRTAQVTVDPAMPHMGWVYGPQHYRKRDHKPKPRMAFRVRVACEHWAPEETDEDCRFNCEAQAQREGFIP